MKTVDRKPNIVLYVAGILLFLTLLSLHVTTGLYAKYVSSSSVNDSAHTASFYIKASGKLVSRTLKIDNIIPGEPIQKELNIENKSEVKIKYTLTVEKKTNNLPIEFNFTCNDLPLEVTPTHGKWIIEKIIDPEVTSENYILNIIWEENDNIVDENLEYMGMVDYIIVTLEAEQID